MCDRSLVENFIKLYRLGVMTLLKARGNPEAAWAWCLLWDSQITAESLEARAMLMRDQAHHFSLAAWITDAMLAEHEEAAHAKPPGDSEDEAAGGHGDEQAARPMIGPRQPFLDVAPSRGLKLVRFLGGGLYGTVFFSALREATASCCQGGRGER